MPKMHSYPNGSGDLAGSQAPYDMTFYFWHGCLLMPHPASSVAYKIPLPSSDALSFFPISNSGTIQPILDLDLDLGLDLGLDPGLGPNHLHRIGIQRA